MIEDAELLQRYARDRSEDALAEVVKRHINFVYQVALREVGGDAHHASDVTQGVFIQVAQKAGFLGDHRVLKGWLFNTARYLAANLVRSERRRHRREKEAHTMQQIGNESVAMADWASARPLINDALGTLSKRDREAVLLRYFEERDFAEIGVRLSLTPDAARLRVERALERMRVVLARYGVISTTAALATTLTAQAALPAPAGMATIVTGAALANASCTAAGATGISILTLMSTAKISSGGVVAAIVLGVSLAANGVLALGFAQRKSAPALAAVTHSPTDVASHTAPASASVDLKSLAPAALRAELTKLGLPKETVEALVRARIFERYDARRHELIFGTVLNSPWWRSAGLRIDPMRVLTAAQRKELRDLEAAARNETLALLGPAALDRDGMIAFRYRFVSPEKAVLLEALERDYKNFGADLDESSRWLRTPGDLEHRKLLSTEHERDLAAMLTPQEREIFDMRASPIANNSNFQPRMTAFDPTEAEYRAVFALQKTFSDQFPQRRGGPLSAEAGAAFFGALNQLEENIHTTLGDARYSDWKLAGKQYYGPLVRLAAENDLSPETVKQVAGIVSDTHDGSWRITVDPALTGPQKKAALAELVASARRQVAEKMGPDLAATYLKNGATFFDVMDSGTAVMMREVGGYGLRPVGASVPTGMGLPPKK